MSFDRSTWNGDKMYHFMALFNMAKFFSISKNAENNKHPGRIGTVVNDRLRRKTDIYAGRTRTPYTGTVYDVKQSETDSANGDRVKIRSD